MPPVIDPLTYLPPGCTEEMFKNRDLEAYQNASEEIQRNIFARFDAEHQRWFEEQEDTRVQRVREMENSLEASGRRPAKPIGLIDYGKEMPALVRALDLEHEDRWGFMVFITTYGRKIDVSTAKWVDDIRPTTTSRLDEYGPHARIDQMKSNECYVLVQEKRLQRASIERVLAEFEDLDQVHNVVPNALNHGYVLVLDEASLKSFREAQPDTPPFILAIDLNHRAKTHIKQPYEGNFKVALTALPDFYAAIKNPKYPRERIWEMANSSGIWDQIR